MWLDAGPLTCQRPVADAHGHFDQGSMDDVTLGMTAAKQESTIGTGIR